MKTTLLKEFEAILRVNIQKIYQKAYAVKGSKAEAELLTEKTLLYGARKFSGLANKTRIIDIMIQKIGVGTHEGFEPCDTEALLSRVIGKVSARGKTQRLLTAICTCILAISAIAYATIPSLTSSPETTTKPIPTTTATDSQGNVVLPVIGAVTMKDTKTILGDNKVVSFENYHNLSWLLKKKTTIDTLQDEISLLERLCDSIIAPDGTAYMVYNNVTKEDGSNIPFSLYRMESDGWVEIATGEAQGSYNENAIVALYYSSRIYLVADEDSNIYVLVLLNDCVTVYKYDRKTGEFIKSDKALPCMEPMNEQTFTIYYDKHTGEKGRIYIAYWKQYKLGFAYYDIAKDEFEIIAEKIGTMMEKYAVFCVKNETIHAVTQGLESGKNTLTYYQIESDGTFVKNRIYTAKGSFDTERENIYYRTTGRGGIAVDETGVVHVVASHFDGGMYVDYKMYLVHYMIDADGNVTKKALPQHYYNDYTGSDRFAHYDPMCALFFIGENGEIYYMEIYDGSENLLVVCELNQDICGESRCVDVIELPDNISLDRIRINQGAVVFYSDAQHILFFELNFEK